MTTDTHPKEAALRVEIGGRRVTIARHRQGTGDDSSHDGNDVLLRRTDLAVEPRGLQGAIRPRGDGGSFNRISVDEGSQHQRTTVIILANGLRLEPSAAPGATAGSSHFQRGARTPSPSAWPSCW